MKTLFGTCAAVAVATLLMPETAAAQATITERCTLDSVDPAGAELRAKWARACGLEKNVRAFNVPFFDTDMPATTGGTLLDYPEHQIATNSGANNFAARISNFEVNSFYATNLYLSGGTSQTQDAWGSYLWERSRSRIKPRPLYATYGTSPSISSSIQLFPHPTLANCQMYYNKDGTNPLPAGSAFYINGICESSCYAPEQKVLFSDGYAPILDAVNARREDMVTLTPDSGLDNIKLMTGRTSTYTVELRDATHPMVEIKTASGTLLRLTVEHPVVTAHGQLVAAQTLKVGDELLKADGTPESIASVTHTKYFGKVYNLRPASTDRVSNLLVAEGYVMGSSLFQNDEVGYMNRVILNHVPDEYIP